MKKSAYFASRRWDRWPTPSELAPYFLAPPGKRWFFETGNDSAGLIIEGVDGSDHLEAHRGRIDIELGMWGDPTLGVLLIYSKSGGIHKHTYSSKGDVNRLREWVRTTHNDPMPVGLYIPYEKAWKAVEEFIKTDGQLPKSIEWIANSDLPPNTFPLPHEVNI